MNIYPSTRISPYVYICVHKTTNQFYIGSRVANKRPSHIDFGTYYKTSRKSVRTEFYNFTWYIVAEFFGPDADLAAYDFEHKLIKEHWGDPLLINESCFHGKARWKHVGRVVVKDKDGNTLSVSVDDPAYLSGDLVSATIGKVVVKDKDGNTLSVSVDDPAYLSGDLVGANKGNKHTTETKARMSVAHMGNSPSVEAREKIRQSKLGKPRPAEVRDKISKSHLGKIVSAETKARMSKSSIGKKKLKITCPHCGKCGGAPVMSRWHMNNCTVKPGSTPLCL